MRPCLIRLPDQARSLPGSLWAWTILVVPAISALASLHAAVGWACAAAPDWLARYVALLFPPLCCAWTAAPCWRGESLALHFIAILLQRPLNWCCAKSAPQPSRSPFIWSVHGPGQLCPCPLHEPAGHRGWAKATSLRAASTRARAGPPEVRPQKGRRGTRGRKRAEGGREAGRRETERGREGGERRRRGRDAGRAGGAGARRAERR